jgi:hypothetical protein
MKRKSLFLKCLMVLGLVLAAFSQAQAQYTFTLEATTDGTTLKSQFDPGEVFYLNIVLNNAGQVAGCAFTLIYPSDVLVPPTTDENGVSSGITSPFPFTYNTDQTHRGNSSESGKIYLAGAAINTGDGGALYSSGGVTLFRIRFQVKSNATPGNFAVSLQQTELWNLAAGYGTDNNTNGVYDEGDEMGKVAVLVGAVPNTDSNWNNLALAFPDLLPTPPSPLAQTSLYTKDGDSIDDAWEIANFGNLTTATDTTDTDHDGYLDRYEQPAQFGGNETNPNEKDDPFVLPHYNAATDERGPYQVALTDPVDPYANTGETFDMDVNYFQTDGAQNLSGLALRIHYDSTKLTWSGFSNVLATGLSSQDSVPQDDTIQDYDGDPTTDKYVTVTWSGGNWPNVTCTEETPARLYTISFTTADGLAEDTTSGINFSVAASDGAFYSAPVTFEVYYFQKGDPNKDGVVDLNDIKMTFMMFMGIEEPNKYGDICDRGDMSLEDVRNCFRIVLGLPMSCQ